jgi:signal peptidase
MQAIYKASILSTLFIAVFTILLPLLAINGKLYAIGSGSMSPLLERGSLVFVSPQNEYLIGDVVTFMSNSKAITHRIVDINSQGYITQGDANNTSDPKQISPEDIIGGVGFALPYAGYLLQFKNTALGFVLVVLLPIGGFLVVELWGIATRKRHAEI